MAKTSTARLNIEHAMSRIALRDVLICGETSELFVSHMARYSQTDAAVDGPALEVASRESLELAYGYAPQESESRKPFVYSDGIAVIPIHGTLINRFNSSWGFVTGYNYIRRMMNLALDDDDVDLIVFDVDSPGGEASGCFELAREIMASRRVKPSLAMVDSLAASGGIALASCATTMYGIPSARIGSIGVYRMHISYEGAMKQNGMKITFATAGEHKIDGNAYQDLPDSVLKDWRESAGKTWDDFIALVAEARDMDEADVRATQARVYRADEALALGLIDAVKTTTEAVPAFVAELADDDPSNDDEEEAMTEKTKGSEVTSGLTAADLQTISSLVATSVATAMSAVTRSQSIKDYAASKGKAFVALGASLASNEAITLEEAQKIIDAAAPAVVSETKKKRERVEEPEDNDDDSDDDDDDSDDDSDDSDEDEADDSDDEAAELPRDRKALKSRGKTKVKGKDTKDHLAAQMRQHKQPDVGGGNQKKGEKSSTDVSSSILADYAAVTGLKLVSPKSKAA